jgi:uncharacterized protein YecT (DUF1311 family)
MKRRILVLLVASLAAFDASQAQDIKCNREGTTVEMAACASQDFSKADRMLNAIFAKFLAEAKKADTEAKSNVIKSSDTVEKRLRAAQRAWVSWRDAECDLLGIGSLGGTAEAIMGPSCAAELTIARTKNLTEQLKDFQGLR